MKKYLASILSLIMALAMVFSFVGCNTSDDDDDDSSSPSTSETGKNNNDDKKKPTTTKDDEEEDDELSSVVGDWVAEIDIADMVLEKLNSSGDANVTTMLEYVDFNGLNMVFYLSFDKKGNCEIYLDDNCIDDMVDDLVDKMLDGIIDMYADIFESQGKSLDEELEAQGMTRAQFKKMMAEEMDIESMFNTQMFESLDFSTTAKYTFDGKTLKIDGEKVNYNGKKITFEKDEIKLVFERD